MTTRVPYIQIIPGASADRDGRLRTGDRILEVNGVSCENVTHNEAVTLLQSNKKMVRLLVSRISLSDNQMKIEDEVVDVELERSPTHGLGFSIAGGVGSEIEVRLLL